MVSCPDCLFLQPNLCSLDCLISSKSASMNRPAYGRYIMNVSLILLMAYCKRRQRKWLPLFLYARLCSLRTMAKKQYQMFPKKCLQLWNMRTAVEYLLTKIFLCRKNRLMQRLVPLTRRNLPALQKKQTSTTKLLKKLIIVCTEKRKTTDTFGEKGLRVKCAPLTVSQRKKTVLSLKASSLKLWIKTAS